MIKTSLPSVGLLLKGKMQTWNKSQIQYDKTFNKEHTGFVSMARSSQDLVVDILPFQLRLWMGRRKYQVNVKWRDSFGSTGSPILQVAEHSGMIRRLLQVS